MNPRIVPTNDGSPTLWSERYAQHYHNRHGAETESRHVFFEQTGLSAALARHEMLSVLEIGFGSGSHARMLASEHYRCASRSHVRFCSVEHDPVDPAILEQMYHAEQCTDPGEVRDNLLRLAEKLYRSDVGSVVTHRCAPHIVWEVFHGSFEHIPESFCKADFVLFDAFSPEANPELWTEDVFKRLHGMSSSQAVLGTYCSATRARAAMVLGGWTVARCAGPPGKREMTLASTNPDLLSGHKLVNAERLRERFGTHNRRTGNLDNS